MFLRIGFMVFLLYRFSHYKFGSLKPEKGTSITDKTTIITESST